MGSMTRTLLLPLAVFSLALTSACDKGDAKPEGDAKADKSDDKAEAKPDTKKAGDDSKQAAGPEGGEAGAAPGDAKHFDVDADKSGMLARNAAVLSSTDATSGDEALRGHLAGLSHHDANSSSDESLCKHIINLRVAENQPEGDVDSCVTHFEHQVVVLGPEVFAQMAQCVLDAKSVKDVEICEAAEKEAEELLHDKHHGDGLSKEVCEGAQTKFEELSVADAGDHGEFIAELLKEIRDDSVQACIDQGTQAEVDCLMKAKDMEALSACEGHEAAGEG
ncbi:predicted methyltransferase [Plesiocystis pacifica SIR-1]|uniref:Predicted methyltransferase n=2 Tax=Plesiocystis pacifica TaxID=191768 RepID=A6GF96_9BACT|nr:predicted methyltransferase [Plesiocystis pacifica SIR-1]